MWLSRWIAPVAALVTLGTGAFAQGAPVPNVNDCTFIRDPIALRDCIDLYQGQRLAPGPRSAALQAAPKLDESLIAAAGPIEASPRSIRRGRSVRRPAPPEPANPVAIPQVAPSLPQ
ncbi:hypothetical protein [Methylobacterium sp. 17Sr1-1]|uniref:hypothetical protein n=1 Tax=Methylobacterium sp. 17Sr1-1 TaxID=2202826 RepID=UPI001FE03398|nr:hypothetical protein [Methylobacterium sp. 17Sr1-1]